MARTGIFFYYQEGQRLRDFPGALAGLLERENVFLYDAFYPSKPSSPFDLRPLSTEILGQVHTPEMVEEVKKTGNYEGALFSAAATVRAAEKIWAKEIDNAFVLTGYGDHHAGTDFFGGGCYFNGVALAIHELRKTFGARRFAIIDTDAHHGDGSWEIFEPNPDVLYVCFCPQPPSAKNNNINIQVPPRPTDEGYLEMVRRGFSPPVEAFQPEVLFWNWGYDGTRGEYGDIGVSPDFHISLAEGLNAIAEKICQGRLIVVLCGGSRRDLARSLIPRIIDVLGGE
jgi:acetoin utilization deacetylase AcuC-like enzyme